MRLSSLTATGVGAANLTVYASRNEPKYVCDECAAGWVNGSNSTDYGHTIYVKISDCISLACLVFPNLVIKEFE